MSPSPELAQQQAQGPELSAEALLRKSIEAQHTNNEAHTVELKALCQSDLDSVTEAFELVYKEYKDQPEMQAKCLQVAEELGLQGVAAFKVTDHVVHGDIHEYAKG